MLTKEQMNILGAFKKDVFAQLTFKQMKESCRQKSNNIIQIALKEFKKQGLVKARQTGDVTSYMLDLGNNLALAYLNLINEIEIRKSNIPKEILNNIQTKILGHTELFILTLFGSYAKGRAAGKSDLDIAVIVESENTKKEVIPYLETIKRREILHIDYHVLTKDEFLEMLRADYENLGKQIYKDNIIYYGFIEYINIIKGKIR